LSHLTIHPQRPVSTPIRLPGTTTQADITSLSHVERAPPWISQAWQTHELALIMLNKLAEAAPDQIAAALAELVPHAGESLIHIREGVRHRFMHWFVDWFVH
jgi:hypothetical protein